MERAWACKPQPAEGLPAEIVLVAGAAVRILFTWSAARKCQDSLPRYPEPGRGLFPFRPSSEPEFSFMVFGASSRIRGGHRPRFCSVLMIGNRPEAWVFKGGWSLSEGWAWFAEACLKKGVLEAS